MIKTISRPISVLGTAILARTMKDQLKNLSDADKKDMAKFIMKLKPADVRNMALKGEPPQGMKLEASETVTAGRLSKLIAGGALAALLAVMNAAAATPADTAKALAQGDIDALFASPGIEAMALKGKANIQTALEKVQNVQVAPEDRPVTPDIGKKMPKPLA